MSLQRISLLLSTILTAFLISTHAQSGSSESQSKIVEKNLAFPWPVQWSLNAGNSNADISLIKLAWGPSTAPEMIAKANEQHSNRKSELFSDRSYVIALGFQARIPRPFLDMTTRSGLVLIKDAAGNMELPWTLRSSGMVRNDYDLHFPVGNANIEYWDFFPVPPDQREFLFEVHSPAQGVLYFSVTLEQNELRVVNSTPDSQSTCRGFEKSFGGNIGADTLVLLQIQRQDAILSGTEQYADVGKTLSLTGVVDSLGYFVIEERYPLDRLTGILKGRFAAGSQTMSGYFSKPDGSRLQRFEFHEIGLPPHQDCRMSEGAEESVSD